jgi:hypothetical protein
VSAEDIARRAFAARHPGNPFVPFGRPLRFDDLWPSEQKRLIEEAQSVLDAAGKEPTR